MKRLFAPVGILTGLAAGLAARKGIERIWGLIDDEDAPAVEQREVSYPKLVAALLLEGGIFSLVKGMVDRGARLAFNSATGRWPGEDNSGK